MISYLHDFTLTAPSLSYPGNIPHLQELFARLEAKALPLGVSFSIVKMELIHWRTPSQRHTPKCLSPIQIKGELFRPRHLVPWLGYWFTPALDSSAHFSHRLAVALGAFALIRHLSPPGPGLAPYLCHRLATSLVAPILLYGAGLLTPSAGAMARLNTFGQMVQRWTTTCFSATPTGIPPVESCLPPVPLLISQRQRLAGLRVICSPPEVNPATAHLYPSFPSLSAYWTHDSRGPSPGSSSLCTFPFRRQPRDSLPPIRNHLPVDAVAHKTLPLTPRLSRMPMINSHLVSPALAVPPQSLMDNTYSVLKKRVRELLLAEGSRFFPAPGHYYHSHTVNQRPFIGLTKIIAGRIHQMRAGKSCLAAHPTGRSPEANTSCHRCGLEHETFEHTILTSPFRQGARTRLLHPVVSVSHQAPLWSSLSLLKRLATSISVTSTGSPPTMFLPTTRPSSPSLSLSPLSVPRQAFRTFSLAEV